MEIVVEVVGGFLPDDAVQLAYVLNELACVAKATEDTR